MSRSSASTSHSAHGQGDERVMEVAERWGEAYGVFQQGNSRVVSVPSDASCEVDDGVRVWSIQKDERVLCVNYVMSYLGTEEKWPLGAGQSAAPKAKPKHTVTVIKSENTITKK
jgi:hypothetical protein